MRARLPRRWLRGRPVDVGPVLRDDDAAGVVVGDLRSVGGDVRVAFVRGRDDAPALAVADGEIGGGGAARDLMLEVFGEADGVVVIDFAAAGKQPAAGVHRDDGAGAFEQPFDATAGKRATFRIDHRGDQDLFRADRQNDLGGAHVDARRQGIEAGEKAEAARCGRGGQAGGGRLTAHERIGAARDASAAGHAREAGRGKQRQRRKPSPFRHRRTHPASRVEESEIRIGEAYSGKVCGKARGTGSRVCLPDLRRTPGAGMPLASAWTDG